MKKKIKYISKYKSLSFSLSNKKLENIRSWICQLFSFINNGNLYNSINYDIVNR